MASKAKKEVKPSETQIALAGRAEVNELKARFANEAQMIVHEIMPKKVRGDVTLAKTGPLSALLDTS